MKSQNTFRGLTTISLFAADHPRAVAWYTELLGVAPYYTSEAAGRGPGYAEFRIGDYEHELGIIDARFAPHLDTAASRPAGVVCYWHVDDLDATLARLISLGAEPLQGKVVQAEGFVTASVRDPFGNILGIMFNRHYMDILAAGSRGDAAVAT